MCNFLFYLCDKIILNVKFDKPVFDITAHEYFGIAQHR